MMVGDGINDVLILVGVYIFVVMGGGIDVVKVLVDMVFIGDCLDKLFEVREFVLKMCKIICENFVWLLGYNLLILFFVVVGLVVFYIVVVGMLGSLIIVVINLFCLLKK